ncbi:hypothetical protein P3X46_017890 [Hevea brasiliensis]|uniref:BED-type domain-containing protein n=1 Tax=Hevea brasiliensis TaxID=3981 RepID=A0ABQ9LP22_HEVBR|nr:hypothetical protein P3X46_017890 [Hevea brasiliensis]
MGDKNNTSRSSASSRRTDPGWAHVIQVSENNTNDLQCMYCMKVYKGGINRIKQHLAGGYENVIRCPKCPEDVRNQMQEFIAKKREQKSIMNMERPPEFDDVEVLGLDENEEEEELMQEIGSERRQVLEVTGTSAFKKPKVLPPQSKYWKQIFLIYLWTPCAAHCIDLMLEDIFKIRVFKETFRKVVELTGFTYGSSGVLNMLRKFTNGVELLRLGQTRFATAFITLGRIHLQKANIRKMFTSESWTTSKWAKEVKCKKCERTVLSPAFWNHVVYALKVSGLLVRVLRLVDNEKKPAMGYIYEAMDRAKEAIANSLNGNEEKYKSNFEIIDARWSLQLHRPLHAAGYFLNPEFFYPNKMRIESDEEVNTGLLSCIHKMEKNSAKVDMILDEIEKYKAVRTFGFPSAIRGRTTKSLAAWWKTYGSSTPNLQKFAIKVLSLTCSASALLRRHTFGDITTPIDLANIDESNEWLLGELEKGDGDDDDDDSLVFMNDVLTWGDVGRAAGVSESRYESRSAARSTPPVETPSFRRPRAMRGASSSQVDDDEEEEEFVMAVVENEDDFGNLDDE